ncbi:WD40 repeat domain-containing protein [Streptomyces sp. NPDC058373]|uniref:WD40 repeat domain-containing protein n=1 Tax=Streptomyces sp. NPDC058373 TaxID=3346465 RepID=UPI003656CDA9
MRRTSTARRRPPRSGRAAAVLAAGALLLPVAPASAASGADQEFTIEDPRITESSGLAASKRHPGVYWTHNDSDDGAYLYAVDSRTGKTVATVTMTGVGEPRDVEAISLGPDGDLYVGDIGDNLGGTWDHVWIYRLPEPAELRDTTVAATQYTVQYEDGPRDAEALMVHPKTGRVYLASKNQSGGRLYAGPEELSAQGVNVFRPTGADVDWVTDGAFSPDGSELVLRSYLGAKAYDWKGDGSLGEPRRLSAPLLGQSESVTYTADGTGLMYGAEGARSRVVRVDVEGRGGGGGEEKAPEGGAKSPGGPASGAPGEDKADGGEGTPASTLGLLAVGAVVLVWLGVRRGRRGGGE